MYRSQGILLKLRFTRSGHKFVFPIQLTPVFDVRVLAASAALPPIFVLMLTKGVEPLHMLHERWKARASSEKHAEVIRRSRQEADAARRLLHNVAQRKRKAETEKGGLVIVRALYGKFGGSDGGSGEDGDDGTGGDEIFGRDADGTDADTFMRADESLVVDVTTAVQFLVDGGRLELSRGVSKSGLFGFCDPCPGVRKELRVVYEHGGRRFARCVSDSEELKLP